MDSKRLKENLINWLTCLMNPDLDWTVSEINERLDQLINLIHKETQIMEWTKASVMLGELVLLNRPTISNPTKKEMEVFAKIDEYYNATNKAIKEEQL